MSLYIYTDIPKLRDFLNNQLNKHRWTDSGFDIPLVHGHSMRNEAFNYGINLHVKVAATEGNKTQPCLLLPRSSIGKTAVRVANSIGLIDQGYRGEVQAKVDIINPAAGDLCEGDRLFQICRHNFLPWENIFIVNSVHDLPVAPDNRGEGGFGSTGH